MFPTNEYKKFLKVGDLIWFHKDNSGAYGAEDIGYVRDICYVKGVQKYKVSWLKSPDSISYTEETSESIREMENSYIFPVL